jgi:uncharacterized membrane protein YphA (DoxX/SURF4 family)
MKIETSRTAAALDFFTVLARWALAAVLIYTGLSKALHPVEFLKLLRQYDLTDSPLLLNSIAAALPWFEIFCGLLLLAGIAVRGTALIISLLLLPFTALVFHRALALHAALDIPFCAVKFNCGCGTGEAFICQKLLENFLLFAAGLWLLAGRGQRFCARYKLF